MSAGRIVLVPNTLDFGAAPVAIEAALPLEVLKRASAIHHWVVEDAKSARAFLKRAGAIAPLAQPLQSLDIRELPRPRKGAAGTAVPPGELETLLAPARAGHEIGLLSEAGLPAVADPGAALVAAAHAAGIAVDVLAGASSITLSVAAGGLKKKRFAFEGYLPQDAEARARRVKELEARSRRESQTQVAIETPYRNAALLAALLAALQRDTRLAIACGLTIPGGWCRMASVERWRRDAVVMPPDVPAVFMWLAG